LHAVSGQLYSPASAKYIVIRATRIRKIVLQVSFHVSRFSSLRTLASETANVGFFRGAKIYFFHKITKESTSHMVTKLAYVMSGTHGV
jgi:hypothetical protein